MPAPPLLWDIFCQVVDNHGDLGVCWRLSRQLAVRGHQVRLWVDDPSALAWMAPGAAEGAVPGVRVLPWTMAQASEGLAGLPRSDVWVEAFGCEIPPGFMVHGTTAASASAQDYSKPPVWINLEYLSAEPVVERLHGLPSPVLHGPAAGWTKWFFYPGFTDATGGLLRETDLAARQATFDRAAWLRAQGIDWRGEQLVSLFCYEPPALASLLAAWATGSQRTHLLVTAGRAAAAVRQAIGQRPGLQRCLRERMPLTITCLPHLPQTVYDELLWACDLNFVRGEDSLVRALWAAAPLVWHIYPQPEDNAHHAKLNAFLDWLDAPASLRRFHAGWNGLHDAELPAPDLPAWQACARAARARLLAQADLAGQLIGFVAHKR